MKLKIKTDDKHAIVEIEGIKYSYQLFKNLGHGFKLNTPFLIKARKDETITVERIPWSKLCSNGKKITEKEIEEIFEYLDDIITTLNCGTLPIKARRKAIALNVEQIKEVLKPVTFGRTF